MKEILYKQYKKNQEDEDEEIDDTEDQTMESEPDGNGITEERLLKMMENGDLNDQEMDLFKQYVEDNQKNLIELTVPWWTPIEGDGKLASVQRINLDIEDLNDVPKSDI